MTGLQRAPSRKTALYKQTEHHNKYLKLQASHPLLSEEGRKKIYFDLRLSDQFTIIINQSNIAIVRLLH